MSGGRRGGENRSCKKARTGGSWSRAAGPGRTADHTTSHSGHCLAGVKLVNTQHSTTPPTVPHGENVFSLPLHGSGGTVFTDIRGVTEEST